MPYKNPEDQRKAFQRHYAANREAYMKRAIVNRTAKRKESREYLQEYLRAHPCVDCGESDIVVLDFDHVRGEKLTNLSSMGHDGYTLKAIQIEIAKCEVRCANCHRRATHRRREEAKKDLTSDKFSTIL